MPSSAAVLITAVVAFATLSSTYATRGVIVTAPRSMERNAPNKVHMSLYDVNAAGIITIALKTTDGSKVIAEKIVSVEEGESEKVIKLFVPETTDYTALMWANGTFGTTDDYTFAEQDEVNFHSTNSKIIFIQTDKPLYKPGQQVKFRILSVYRDLRPLREGILADIWIEDPSRSRLAQWKNVSLAKEIVQYEFPLSEEPPLGSYKITVEMPDISESTNFDVKEYVLPKYEVTITPPSWVLADAEIIPVKVCAKYTYGKLVQGTLKINNSLESYSWSSEKFPVFEIEDKINGCYNYDLNVSLIDSEFSYVYRRIEIFVQVTEDGTEVQRNGTATVQRTYDPMTLEFLVDYYRQYFKPRIPYYKKVKATKPDKTPAPGEEIEVCATIVRERVLEHWWATRKVKFCKNYTSDEDGIVLFQVPPQKTDTISLYLEAKSMKYGTTASAPGRPKLYQPQTSTSVQPYYSPSKSYILVQNSDDTFQCGTSQNLKVLYTAQDGKEYTFHYQVISKGEVVEKGTKVVAFSCKDDVSASMCKDSLSVNDVRTTLVPSEIEDGTTSEEDIDCSSGPIGATEIPVEINARLSPSFTLLLYYIREDDETVADSTQFQVDKCFQNKVEFRFGDEEKQPGAKTSFTLKASPNSLCGTKVVDKSITLLDSSDQLTKEKVFDALKRFDNQQYYQRNHCNDKFRKGGKDKMAQSMILPPRPWSSSQYADALTAFEDAGLIALSDLKMLTRPCNRGQGTSYDSYGGGSIALASVGVRGGQAGPQRRPMATTPARRTMYKSRRPAAASFDSAPESVQGLSKVGSSATKSVVDVRSYFPETFLFDLLSVGEIGELISKVTLPHTITEWIGNAVCINEADGLGLSDTASIRGFQAFFLEFTLPYSLIRGEKATIPISIFNYLDKCIPVTMSISASMMADNGTEEDSTSHDVCVCKTYTYKYTFSPLRVGTVNITVLAESAQSSSVCGDQETADVVARDMATQPLKVEPEGFPQEKVESFLFCPEDYDGSTYVSKFELSTPDDVVEGSGRAFMFLSGDIMGPAIDGLDRLVQLPTGCGEQNMALFTPNIVVLDYLKSTGKLTDAIKEKATRNLQTGYQRELKYRHPDGSYSAFGVTDKEGSMWLSAFVLMSFSQAKPYIDIDEKDISRTEKWIVEKQQGDGCFPQVGKLFSQGMKGGIGSQGKESTAPLTAYVLIALLTSDYKNETVINGALTCIETDENLNPYKAALYGYATALANKAEADRYLEYLSQRVIREGDETYWKNVNASESIDVETAAYAIMTILKRKEDAGLAQTLSIVKHMTAKRNSNGGFISTQDTVVGLQAISLFASIISQDPVDLKVELTGGRLEETALITEDDKLVVKRFRVPDVPSTIGITATGAGCGLIQAAVRYNTIRVPKLKFFSVNINATRSSECKKANINICVSYIPENQKSNMALVEIKMISGFAAIKETLDKVVEDPKTSLKRYETENNNVVLYFDEMSNDMVCINFDVEEIFEVEDNKPATVKAYDYYAKEREESAAYSISGSC